MIETEQTPNPDTLKFLPGKKVSDVGPIEFLKNDKSIKVPLAKKILSLDEKSKDFIVECGSFKGASSVALSIFSKTVNRKLITSESFSFISDIISFISSNLAENGYRKYSTITRNKN